MKLGIIGKPQAGKTTVFNAAAGQQAAVGDFSQAMHRAVIKVPDERLDKLAEIVGPKKVVSAEIEYLDAPGLTGKGKESASLEISPEIRQMDAFLLVIDAFTDRARPDNDIQNLMDEMILIDQAMIESNIDKRQRKMKLTGDKAEQRELDLLKRCLGKLEEERPLIDLDFGLEERRIIRGYQLLTCKPVLIVLNVPEEALAEADSMAGRFQRFVEPGKREIAVMCGKIEAELVTLEEEERAPFLEELGIGTPAIDLVIRRSYALLGLISFFTTTGPEIRAWTIPGGTEARKAAGVVHADMERGFIRAEVVSYDDFIEHRTPAALKAAGKMRLEGKDYTIGDGDVVLFRFNV